MNEEEYKPNVTSISGYCGRNYEENLERFKKELEEKGGYIDGIVTIKSIIIYHEKINGDESENE